MRRLTTAVLVTIALTSAASAQGVSFPTLTFPQPDTFCGPLQLCPPEPTQDA